MCAGSKCRYRYKYRVFQWRLCRLRRSLPCGSLSLQDQVISRSFQPMPGQSWTMRDHSWWCKESCRSCEDMQGSHWKSHVACKNIRAPCKSKAKARPSTTKSWLIQDGYGYARKVMTHAKRSWMCMESHGAGSMKEIPSSLRRSVKFWVAWKVFPREDNPSISCLLGDLPKMAFWIQVRDLGPRKK